MKKYSILIVGLDCYFGHIGEFIINLKKKNPLVEITLLTTPILKDRRKSIIDYVDRIVFYKPLDIKFLPRFLVQWLHPLLCNLRLRKSLKKDHFDILDIHFPAPFIIKLLPFFRKKADHIVISPWGSDVMRVEDEQARQDLSRIFAKAEYVTVGKESRIGKVLRTEFKVNPDKMVKLEWGGEFFDFIQNMSGTVSVEEAKDRFGLKDRYVITCGYNTSEAQQHEKIIRAVADVKDRLPDNLTLQFLCTNVFFNKMAPEKEQYLELLKNECAADGLDAVLIKERLDLPDLLKLRMSADIFIHIQTTDAGSRSVMEYVACNRKVVHGTWNRYAYLEDYKPACYFPLDSLEDLGSRILDAYHGEVEELPSEVKRVIHERGWDHKMTLWNDFFESLC